MKKLLIIEDEAAISMALEDDFKLEGYDVTVANDGKTGLQLGMDINPDIILLDIMLPGMSGLDVCKALRRNGFDTPIILLTAKSQEIDKILGLELGADDYVTKPFSPHVLQARVRALLRRSESRRSSNRSGIHQVGDLQIDYNGHQVLKNDQDVRLTTLEFTLLKYFLENDGKVLSRDDILDTVWNDDVMVEPRTVDAHVAHLRKKIEDDPSHPKWIIGVRGVGYKFVHR